MSIPTFEVSCGNVQVDLVSVFITAGIFFCLYLIVSLTVNLEFGYAGVPNFGKVLFVSAGGLIAGSVSYRLLVYIMNLKSTDIIGSQGGFIIPMNNLLASNGYLSLEVFLLSLAVGASVAAAVGYLASFPAIRLREDYLGMLLLAAGQFFLIFDRAYYPINGGDTGLLVPDPLYSIQSIPFLRDPVILAILAAAAGGVYLYAEFVARSPLGRMMRAVRDNEISADALGKDTIGVRRNILIIASALCGIAGVLFVLWVPAISDTTFTRTEWTFYPFVIVILGGAANNLGVGIGSAVFVGITQTIFQARTCILGNGISLPVDINAIEPIAVGVLLLVVLLWRPNGLWKEKPTVTLKKKKLKAIFDRMNNKLSKGISAPALEQSTPFDDKTKGVTSQEKSSTEESKG